MYALALIAVNHPESQISHAEGLELLRTASDAGQWKASAVLGVLARDGKWVAQSSEEAYRYFKRASVQGGDPVKEYISRDIQRLSAVLSQSSVAALDSEATEWANSHPMSIQLIHKSDRKTAQARNFALTFPPSGEHAGDIVPTSD
jgi:hypothetical protein